MDDVEPSECEGERQVRTRTDRHADPAAARDGYGRADRHHVRVEPVEKRPPAGSQISSAVRRREHDHCMTERAELSRDPCHVLVDVVRLRPGEGRDEADPQTHRTECSEEGPVLTNGALRRWLTRPEVRLPRPVRPGARSPG